VWLALELAGGPRWSVDLETAAKVVGISPKRLRSAKFKCNAKSGRVGGSGPWFTYLPQHSGMLPGSPDALSGPMFSERASGASGEKPDTPNNLHIYPYALQEIYGNTGKRADQCDCGAQLTNPASIRYGKCQECRTIASNDDEPPF
jgi:hypothetical protein